MWAESTADDKADAINLTAAERTHKQKPLYSFSNSVAEHDNRPKQTACIVYHRTTFLAMDLYQVRILFSNYDFSLVKYSKVCFPDCSEPQIKHPVIYLQILS